MIQVLAVIGSFGFIMFLTTIAWRFGYSEGKKSGYTLGHRQGWIDGYDEAADERRLRY